MKKVLIWVSLGLMFLGVALFCCVGVSIDFDFARLDNMKYITNTHTIYDDFTCVVLNSVTAEIEFKPSEDGYCRVVCYEQENACHDVSVTNGVLEIAWMDSRNWMDHISVFSFHTPTITIYLPEGNYQSLKVYNSTGDINIEGEWQIDEVSLKTSTGDVYAKGLYCSKDVSVNVTTGDVKLENINCKNLTLEGSTGKTELDFVIANEALRVNRTTGDIMLYCCDGDGIFMKTTTGNVTGTLRSSMVISAHSTTGRVDVPHCTSGGHCEIETTTGDICIEIN